MADVFISYKKEDRVLVERIANALQACDVSVWWDDSLAGGHQFRHKIKEELRAAGAVIVVWTKRSVESDWVLDEADDAKSRGKLLPVRFASDFEVPFGFRQTQVENLNAWNGTPSDEIFKRIVGQIEVISARKFSVAAQVLGTTVRNGSQAGLGFARALMRSLSDASFLGLPLDRFLRNGLAAAACLTAIISFFYYTTPAPPLFARLLSDACVAVPFFFVIRGVHQYVMYRKGAGSRRVFDSPFRFWIWLAALVAIIYITIFEVREVLDVSAYLQAFPVAFLKALGLITAVRLAISWFSPRSGEPLTEPT